MMRHTAWMSMLPMLLVATVSAQDQPDFSGRWVLAAPPAAGPGVARSLTVLQPIVGTNVYGAPMTPFFKELTVERQFLRDVRTDTYQIGVAGASSGVGATGHGSGPDVHVPETRFSVRWEGARLAIDSGVYSGPTRAAGPYTEHSEVWQLDAAGMLIVSVTDRGSGTESTTNILTYRKR
jgi:hypothetical protein